MARVSKDYYELIKSKIINAALEVCKRKTVCSTTMQDVINETGMSQGAIYRYFANVDEILTCVLNQIRTDQNSSVERLNSVFEQKSELIHELRELPINNESIYMRRKLCSELIKEIHEVWCEEISHFLYPHKKLELEFIILADSFPDRARRIFPNAIKPQVIDTRIYSELSKEIEDGVLKPRIPLSEFMEYNAAVYDGINRRAIACNCYQRNANYSTENTYDIKSRYNTFARSSAFFLGIEEFFEYYNVTMLQNT